MAGAHGDAHLVEQRAQVQGVQPVDDETHHGVLRHGVGRSYDAQAVYLLQLFVAVGQQLLLVAVDVVHAQGVDVVDGGGQAVGGHIVGRSGLELKGQLVVGGSLPADAADHLAAALIGWQAVEPRLLSVEHAHAGGAVHLVAAQGQEVAVQLLHVDAEVGCALCGVDEHGHAVLMGPSDDVGHRVHRAQHVAHVCEAEQAGALADVFVEQVGAQQPVVADGQVAHHDAAALGLHLPGHDVGVVLHVGEQHLVAGLHVCRAEGGCHQVDGLGGAACEDDFGRGAGVEESAHALACCFVQLGGLLAEVVHASVHVGVGVEVLAAHGVEHRQRLLRGGGIVEVNQRAAMHLPREYGEVAAYDVDVIHKSVQRY